MSCRNCGAPRKGQRCQDCGTYTGSQPVVARAKTIERRQSINFGLRRIYEAMFKSGALKLHKKGE